MWKKKAKKQASTGNIVTVSNFSKLPKKKLFFSFLALFVLTVAVGLVALVVRDNDENKQDLAGSNEANCSTNEHNGLLDRSRNATTSSKDEKFDQLQKIVEEIQGLPNYKDDANCVYTVMYFYMSTSQIEEARGHHQILKKHFEEGKTLDEGFLTTPKEIDEQIAFLEVLEEQAASNSFNSGPPPEVPDFQ